MTIDQKKEKIVWAWSRLEPVQRFVFNKLITGGFRIGVSQQLMVKALAKHAEVKENIIAHRLMGNWSPEYSNFQELVLSQDTLDIPDLILFTWPMRWKVKSATWAISGEWQAEWKWDGIRGQVIVRNRELFVWARGEELVTDKYPEIRVFLDLLPDGTAIDGEILPFKNDLPLSFNKLQTRIGRKSLSQKQLKEVPVAFITYDLLEWQGVDIRDWPLEARRNQLAQLCSVKVQSCVCPLPLPLIVGRSLLKNGNVRENYSAKESCSSARVQFIVMADEEATGGNGKSIHSPSML